MEKDMGPRGVGRRTFDGIFGAPERATCGDLFPTPDPVSPSWNALDPFADPPSAESSVLARELRELLRTATGDTIGPALRAARERVAAAPPEIREEVGELMNALERMERWLRDF
jgi:hypothetical protein